MAIKLNQNFSRGDTYLGLAADTKPLAPGDGSRFHALDTDEVFVFYQSVWYGPLEIIVGAGGGGGGGGGETNTSSNAGAGEGLALAKVGSDLPFKTLVEGTNITLTSGVDTVTIDAAAGSGETNTSSNSGAGEGLAQTKAGVDLPFKSLVAGTNVTLTPAADTVTINATGGVTDPLSNDLDVGGFSIVSAAAGNILITPNTTGSIVLDGLSWPQADGTVDQVIKTNGAGQLSFADQTGGGAGVDNPMTEALDLDSFDLIDTNNAPGGEFGANLGYWKFIPETGETGTAVFGASNVVGIRTQVAQAGIGFGCFWDNSSNRWEFLGSTGFGTLIETDSNNGNLNFYVSSNSGTSGTATTFVLHNSMRNDLSHWWMDTTAPATPPAGFVKLYINSSDNLFHAINENGLDVALDEPGTLDSYTVAGLPAQKAGRIIYVSDETGGAVTAFSDGTNWRRTTDRAIVA